MDSNRLEKEIKKEKIEKLEKKLQSRKLTIYQALQEDCVMDWLKTGHPGFLTMLTPSAMVQIISYVVVPGPPDNKIRSFKLPQASADFLASMAPKVIELFFTDCELEKGTICLDHLLAYFNTQPNFVISGYVVKILMNLMLGNGPRVMEHIMKNKPQRMIKFAGSQSIVDFLLRMMIVEDVLLNCAAKERIQLFGNIIDVYVQNKESQQILANLNQILCQAITRLWTNKHKQLGRYSSLIFKIIQNVIDQNNLYQQQNLILIVMRHLTLYQKEAPYLVIALYKKIYNEFASARGGQTVRNQGKLQIPKFTMRKLKMLQSLHFIFSNSPDIIAKQLISFNVFSFLLEFVYKYEWNSIVLVQIEKILRVSFASGCEGVFQGIIRSHISTKLKDLIRSQTVPSKFGHGYSGFLRNIITLIDQNVKGGLPFALYLKKNHPENDLAVTCSEYVSRKDAGGAENEDSYKVVHDVAHPQYSFSRLSQVFRDFFQQAEQINAKLRRQKRSIVTKSSQGEDVLHQIQNQNELVYQLLTQNAQAVEEKKEIENANE